MASLRNQGNTRLAPLDHPLKPGVRKPIASYAHQPGQVIRTAKQDEVIPVAPSVVATKIPSLSGLRESMPQVKRQRLLHDTVQKGGKENGFLAFAKRPNDVPDIYLDSLDSESMVVAYVEHIHAYLHQRENPRLSSRFMEGLTITSRMRTILVDWMVSVAYKFKLCQDTLYLSLDIVDRFLAVPTLDIKKEDLQLIGVTALFLGSKFEEVYPPDLDDFCYISDNSCTKHQIVEMEMLMANLLNFDFTRPLPPHFLRRCCKAAGTTQEEYSLAKYITELSLLCLEFVEIKPSQTAAAAVYLTLLFRRGPQEAAWNSTMEYYTTYKFSEIKPLAAKLLQLVIEAPQSRQQCIFKKYLSAKNHQVAEISGDPARDALKYF